jgi:CRISPR-associated protein Cas5t
VLGVSNQNDEIFRNGLSKLKLSVSGRFDNKVTEYIWFRNMSKKAHIKKFGYVNNRENNGHIEHPGGQSPMKIDILNDVHLIIYLGHEKLEIIDDIKSNLVNPINRHEILHIGRAEDWIVFEDKPKILSDSDYEFVSHGGNYEHFFWIPQKFYIAVPNWNNKANDNYEGLLYNVPTFSKIEGYEDNFNRHGKRTFEYVRTKLNDGMIVGQELMIDKELQLPIFLGELNGK